MVFGCVVEAELLLVEWSTKSSEGGLLIIEGKGARGHKLGRRAPLPLR